MAGVDVGDFPGVSAFPQPVGAGGTVGPVLAETFDRRLCTGTGFQPTTATLTSTVIYLPAGLVVSGITFVSGATAESGGSHLWYALYKCANPNGTGAVTLMAQSTNDTNATAFSANTAFRKALATAQKLTYSGWYYLSFMCVGTTPSLAVITTGSTNLTGAITGMTPMVASTADAALTTTAPSTMGAQTALTTCMYAFVD